MTFQRFGGPPYRRQQTHQIESEERLQICQLLMGRCLRGEKEELDGTFNTQMDDLTSVNISLSVKGSPGSIQLSLFLSDLSGELVELLTSKTSKIVSVITASKESKILGQDLSICPTFGC